MISPGRIPVGPFIRVLEERLEQHTEDGLAQDTIAGEIWEKSGMRRLRALREQNFITFKLADKIITGIDVHLWHSDPELREIYENVDLRPSKERYREMTDAWKARKRALVRKSSRTCSECGGSFVPGPKATHKLTCSTKCSNDRANRVTNEKRKSKRQRDLDSSALLDEETSALLDEEGCA